MATTTYPGVYIQELASPVHPITGVATSIGAFVGYTARGIDQRAQQIFSFADFERMFGGLASNSELSYAVQQFFGNGGSQAYVVRVPKIGASGASVVFDGLTFTALSSGSWANGNLLIDIDYNNLALALSGSVGLTNGLPTVTGSGFQSTLSTNDWLIFASDPTQTPYQIQTINSNTSLTLGAHFAGPTGATSAVVITDPTAFNLTITDVVDTVTEHFSNVSLNSAQNNYVVNVVNDPDNGSGLVNVVVGTPTPNQPPPQTGLVGKPPLLSSVDTLLGGTAIAGSVTVANNSTTVTGIGTSFTTLSAGQFLIFASDPTLTPYDISAKPTSDTSLSLATAYTGVSTVTSAVVVNAQNPTSTPTLKGTVNLTNGSALVAGTGTTFLSALSVGQSVIFDGDATKTIYQVASISSNLQLTLTQKYSGTTVANSTVTQINTTASANFAIQLTTASPTTPPSPLPVTVTVFAQNTPIPQTVAGLSSQLQMAINSALRRQMLGASVVCSVSGTGAGQAIRVNATIPQFPDAVIGIIAPPSASGLLDASGVLGFTGSNAPVSVNVAHYALGTANGTVNSVSNTALAGTVDLTANSFAVVGTGTSFTSDLVGQWLVFAADGTNTPYLVSSVTDATHLTLAARYTGTASANSATTVYSWGGQQTNSVAGLDGSGLPGTLQLIGDPGLATGIYALQNVDQFNLMCIPDATRAVPGNPAVLDSSVDPNAIYSAAIALCDSKLAFLLLDCPPYVNTVPAAVDWKTSGLTVSDPNGAAFFPRLRLPDPLNNYNLRTFAPCGVVAGLYAQTDSSRGVWKAPAGTAATLSGVQSVIYKMSDAENGVLNPLGLNCFRTFPIYGSVLWGARTLVGADAQTNQWKYVPVRRVALFLEASLYQGTQWVVFEPNDEPLWSAIRLNIGSFMQNLFQQGYFQGSTPSQAYLVKCDGETTTQTDINNGVVNIVVGFAPLEPAEFVIIKIQQLAGQTGS